MLKFQLQISVRSWKPMMKRVGVVVWQGRVTAAQAVILPKGFCKTEHALMIKSLTTLKTVISLATNRNQRRMDLVLPMFF